MSSRNVYQENDYPNDRELCAQVNNQGYASSVSNLPNNCGQNMNMYDCMSSTQTMYRNQNNNANLYGNIPSENSDNASWMLDYRLVADIERSLKFPDKMETIEITSKDLSPGSCCSNLDLLLPDCYKSANKDGNYYNKMNEKQWYCNTNYNYQKYNEYPSCAQVANESNTDMLGNTVRYCSIQKTGQIEGVHTNFGCNSVTNAGDYFYYNKSSGDITDCQSYNFDMQQFYPENQIVSAATLNYDSLQQLEQRTDASNEESDIIVEESDEDVTDCSEDYTSNCIVCNILYTPSGSQFYILTAETPLTMSSQKPVITKIKDILGALPNNKIYLCYQCLGLINSIDHLQLKLKSYECELFEKYKKTCSNNNLKMPEAPNVLTKKSKRWKTLIFHCKMCKKRYSLKNFCRNHMMKHKKRKFLCELCGKQFDKLRQLKVHLKHHNENETKSIKKLIPFLCKICNKTFRTNSNLKEHTNYCSGLLPYSCKHSDCDKKFPSLTKMKNHVKLKHDKKFSAICSICNIGFVKMSDYKSHMITHSTDKKYSCSKCEKSYKTLSNLNFHMKLHSDTLPFVCEICRKGFMRKEYLEAHVNMHNGIRNFACQLCDKKFVSQKNLDSHVKYHDGSVKKKSCNICGKLLSTGFEEHLRTHTNLREFECEQCEVRFNTKGALAKHRKNKHLK